MKILTRPLDTATAAAVRERHDRRPRENFARQRIHHRRPIPIAGIAVFALIGLAVSPSLAADLEPLPQEQLLDVPPTVDCCVDSGIIFVNETDAEIGLVWIDYQGRGMRVAYVAPGQTAQEKTYEGHIWLVVDRVGDHLAVFKAGRAPERAVITSHMVAVPAPPKRDEESPVSVLRVSDLRRLIAHARSALLDLEHYLNEMSEK